VSQHQPPPLTYRDAGVDIDRGNRLVDRVAGAAARTARTETLAGIGGFGALFRVPTDRYREPVLVSGTDGVGTKLMLALAAGHHRGVGVDLVAMCVNDVLTLGAEPLFFLDYYATGRLDEGVAGEVVEGIADGCVLAGAALIGGETAEMPGMYADGEYDLAGFCVGVVERSQILDGGRVRPGDVVLGLASSGPHANGYSLVRRILARTGAALDRPLGHGTTLGDALLAPTRIYVHSLRAALNDHGDAIHALAHITGGGLLENVPRVLPPGCRARIDASAWPRPAVFRWLEENGPVAPGEMLRTFNCGIGMVVVAEASAAPAIAATLADAGEQVHRIGAIESSDGDPEMVIA
jgi:phosphoribosylformylglycinamidine cyclo-ligase